MGEATVRVYDSQSQAYHRAFQVFLDHTDQKRNARQWLDGLVQTLPSRRVFVDAGAGNGQVTCWYADQFERTVAIEPNPSLAEALRHACPSAEVLPVRALDADPGAAADLVLCSHVLYYIDQGEWGHHLARMASWLAPTGALAVTIQDEGTDCMGMVRAFLGRSFSLATLARQFEKDHGRHYRIELHPVPARIAAPDLATAYVVAEFMLNLLPMEKPPAKAAVEKYVQDHFAAAEGGFRFSCDQLFLLIRRHG